MDETIKVLILEDVPEDAELVEQEFKKTLKNYTLQVTDNEAGFVEALKNYKPDLILSDYNLPQFNGMEAIKLTKEISPLIPVIIVTGSINEEIAVECIKAGAGDYVIKENLLRLGPAVSQALEKKTLIEAKRKAEESIVEGKQKLELMIQNSPDLLMIQKTSGEVDYVSSQCKDILGFTEEEIKKLELKKQIHPDDLTEVIKKGSGALKGDDLLNYEYRFIKKSGDIVWLDHTAKPVIIDGKISEIQSTIRDITERKQAEEQIAKLSIAVEQSPSVIVITDLKGNIEYVNPKFTHITGYTSEEVIGQNTKILNPGRYPKEFYENLWITISGGFIWRGEFHNKKKNGEMFWEAASISPILDEQGKIINYIKVSEDITERNEAEEALKTSEAQLSNAVEIAKLGYWEYDVDSALFTFNDHFYNIFRTTVEKVGGYKMSPAQYTQQFVHPDDMKLVVIELKKAFQTTDPNYSLTIEHRIIYADGEIGYISVKFYIEKDDKGRTIKIFGANQDITKRKETELETIINKEKYESIFETAANLITSVDINGTIVECNSRMFDVLGYTKEEIIGQNMTKIIHPDYHQKASESLNEILTNGISYNKEYIFIKKNGTQRNIIINSSGLKGGNGNYHKTICIMDDITERKMAEEKEKIHHSNLDFLSKTAMQLVEFPQDSNIYDFVGEKIREIVGKDSYIVVNSVDRETGYSTIHSVLGVGKFAKIITNKLGRNPVGMKFDVEDTNIHYQDGRLHVYQEGLYGILLKTVPKSICKSIEKLGNVNKIYVIDLAKQEQFFESVIIFLKDKTGELKNKQLLETFIKQASIAVLKKQAEEQVKRDLEEKKVLLQEIYHRTKNNMQVIASMLKLKSRQSDNDFVHDSFTDIVQKIQAMSLVHQKLYQAEDLSMINLREYIEDILMMMIRSNNVRTEYFSYKLELKDVFITIDSAIPLGLVLNELISNVFKHSFPNDRKGKLTISLEQGKNGVINIQLADDGVGLPSGFDPEKTESMGLQTMYSLVIYQLSGSINYEVKNGLSWFIKFNDAKNKLRV
jgi:PAS domain S-box-containing protein